MRVHCVNYRHVIHALRRKPQALAGSVYRDGLFPRSEYAEAWAALSAALPRRDACRRMVDLLCLAHDEGCEAELAGLIADSLAEGAARSPRIAREAGTAIPRAPGRHARHADRSGQLRRPAGGLRMTAVAAPRPVDVHALPTMLTALRLPSFQRTGKRWPSAPTPRAGRPPASSPPWPSSNWPNAMPGASSATSSSPSCPAARRSPPSTSRRCPG
jgi:hypothetical protein